MNQFDKECDQLDKDLESGALSSEEYNKEMRELERDRRDAAEQASQEAYDSEYNRW